MTRQLISRDCSRFSIESSQGTTGVGLILMLAVVLCVPATVARAQTGPALLIKPWLGDEPVIEGYTAATVAFTGETGGGQGGTRQDVAVYRFDAIGRARIKLDQPWMQTFYVGTDHRYTLFDTADPLVPRRLVDQSFAVGADLIEQEKWSLHVAAGLGFAGNHPYVNHEALYGMVDVFARINIHEDGQLYVGLNYNGNRGIFPDVPLPTIVYRARFTQQWAIALGLPYAQVDFTPIRQLRFSVRYFPVDNVTASASYTPVPWFTIEAKYFSEYRGYHIDGMIDTRRMFVSSRNAELLARITPLKQVTVELAAGFTFDQSLEMGFDTRNTDTIRDLPDQPYVRIGVAVRF